jgi:hypothetical protein
MAQEEEPERDILRRIEIHSVYEEMLHDLRESADNATFDSRDPQRQRQLLRNTWIRTSIARGFSEARVDEPDLLVILSRPGGDESRLARALPLCAHNLRRGTMQIELLQRYFPDQDFGHAISCLRMAESPGPFFD